MPLDAGISRLPCQFAKIAIGGFGDMQVPVNQFVFGAGVDQSKDIDLDHHSDSRGS